MKKSVIVSAVRTPVGSFMGALSKVNAVDLGAKAVAEVVKQAGIDKSEIEYVIMGCVLSAGVGQSPARQVIIKSGLSEYVQALTINKVCGSGLKSVMIADQMIRSGDHEVVIAGGMESMSNAPYLLPGARDGLRMGNKEVVDSMINDGLWDVYNDVHMGACADEGATKYSISRERQDEFAALSYRRSQRAIADGDFKDEIVPVEVPQRKGEPVIVDTDEGPGRVKFDKIPKLRPAFSKDGTVTAANASSINDGAAAFLVMSQEKAAALGLKPLATIVSHAGYSHQPKFFTTAPVGAMKKLFAKTSTTPEDIDLYEINEAFSFVTLHAADQFKIDLDKVNVNGGSVAIGHPIGASGARILVTLLHAMKNRKVAKGMASLCIGGGEAVAMLLETS
ncbi:MAG: acetyl-CoA C-acetyltransferase [Myxococcota bacterium]